MVLSNSSSGATHKNEVLVQNVARGWIMLLTLPAQPPTPSEPPAPPTLLAWLMPLRPISPLMRVTPVKPSTLLAQVSPPQWLGC